MDHNETSRIILNYCFDDVTCLVFAVRLWLDYFNSFHCTLNLELHNFHTTNQPLFDTHCVNSVINSYVTGTRLINKNQIYLRVIDTCTIKWNLSSFM